MKLKKIFEKYAHLKKDGFLFNPDEEVFYTTKPKKEFNHPTDFEEWGVEEIKVDSYLNERLKELGVSKKENEIELYGGVNLPDNEPNNHSIFVHDKTGNIGIMQYSLKRKPYTFFEKSGETTSAINREHYHEQIRLAPWNEYIMQGKYDFARAKNVPFWAPSLVEEFEAEEKSSDTLIITEGQFKAFKGAKEGLPVVGLTSISHYRNKESGTIHGEIIEYIKECRIKKVIILWDGDCKDISMKQIENEEDLSKRPYNFYKFATTIKDLIQDFIPARKLSIYFATIKTSEIENNPKGLDDLFLVFPKSKKDILKDFELVGEMPCQLLDWVNITSDQGVKKLVKYFNLTSAKSFYQVHQGQIKDRDFIFRGNTYRIENNFPVIKISASLKQYKRIGTEYYRVVQEPVPVGMNGEVINEEALIPWTGGAIQLDHGKDTLKHIEKFMGFTNQANHVDYQQVINGHWNLYQNIEHNPVEGEFVYIKKLLKHLFQEQYEMVLDYLSVLYRHPLRKLPVVCLVSKEQKTGKSTFIYLLKLIFRQNMTTISNNDLTGDFNSHWTSKLIVASEETLLEKKDGYEKIKAISTAKNITRNEKNKGQKEIPCMVHFVFCSNHENDFIKIDDYDSRLWIRKVGSITEKIKGFDEKLESEISAFVHFIQNREIKYEDVGERLYFDPKDFKTEAFYNVVKHSEPAIIKEIRSQLEDLFLVTGVEEIHMTIKDIKSQFSIRPDSYYVSKEINTYLKFGRLREGKPTTYSFAVPEAMNPEKLVLIKGKGRPFVFRKKDYVNN